MAMRWDRAHTRSVMHRSERARHDAIPVSDRAPLTEVYRFELPCGLVLGLVRKDDGEVAYGRFDRSSRQWRLGMSPWMREEIDVELDRLDREAAEREEGLL